MHASRPRRALPPARTLIFWAALALPAALMTRDWHSGVALPMDLIEPSGDLSIRLMVLALLPGPLTEFFGGNRLLRGWLAIRRNLGVASFGYAVLHLALYAIDMNSLGAMAEELTLPGIWTGWLALALLVPAAATSMDRAMRALGRRWKSVQRIVHLAVLVAFAHWLLLEWSWQKAAIHALPLIAAWILRAAHRIRTIKRSPT